MLQAQSEYDPTLWLRNHLEDWLSAPDPDIATLADYLQGYGLPAVGHDEEPYIWLYRALRHSTERFQAERQCARVLGNFLDTAPEATKSYDRPDQLTHNALGLCASLSDPDELFQPVYRFYQRRRFEGEWNGICHGRMLLLALIENQTDGSLKELWLKLIGGEEDPMLKGDWLDGLEGLIAMRPAADVGGCDDVIFSVLPTIIENLHERPDAVVQFRGCLSHLVDRCPELSEQPWKLVSEADRFHWPAWAVRCLPRLCFFRDSGRSEYVLWRPILNFLQNEFQNTPLEYVCNGEVVVTRIPDGDDTLLVEIAETIEDIRRKFPFPAHTSGVKIILGVLGEVRLRLLRARTERETCDDTLQQNTNSQTAIKRILDKAQSRSLAEERIGHATVAAPTV